MVVGVYALALGLGCGADPARDQRVVQRPNPVVVAGADASTLDTLSDVAPEVEPDVAPDAEPDSAGETADEVAADSAPDAPDASLPVLPLSLDGDTTASSHDGWDRYACAPDIDESGPEDVYTLPIERLGILRVRVDDVAGDAVDVDVHLLSAADPATRVRRDNKALAWVVRPGTWTLVVDTWVGGDGVAHPGRYHLDVDLLPLDSGPCANEDKPIRMVWSGCAPGPNAPDCLDDGTTRRLRTPSLGPVVGEAHLVTVDEDFAGDGWPTALRDQIDRHYQISQAATGVDMVRGEPWAPEGEGGSHWGGGATGQKLPVVDEAWYVNMYWRDRPTPGRRVLVVEPWSGRAVVAAGGWETGPGSNTAIGGACEEVHHSLGTSHRDDLVMGFLVDDQLPLGPITCWP
ncbi:MAG: hypothetical protein U1F43_06930 [Myxococcota bacterium]